MQQKKENWGDFSGGPVVESSPSNAGGVSSIPGQEAKIPHASGPKSQNIKQKQHCNKFNKDLKINKFHLGKGIGDFGLSRWLSGSRSQL